MIPAENEHMELGELTPGRVFIGSKLTVPGGMAVVWILNLMGNRSVSLIYGPDLLVSLCELSTREDWTHNF